MSEALLLLVVIGAVALTAIARRTGLQAGLIIVIVAAGVSFIPGLERLELEPELILGLVMPPLLYSATQNFSFFSFVRYRRPIVGLGLGLVLVSALAVTGLVSWLVPSIGAAGALVLASTVAPPDTVTTVTHGRELGLSKRVVAILTGESLVNDATALALFAFAVSLAAGSPAFIANPVWLLLYGIGIGIVVGVVLGFIANWLRHTISNPTLEATVSVLVPFTAFLVAEQLHASGVLAVVVAGFSVAVSSAYSDARRPSATAHLTRLQERNLWPVIDTLLESFVFAYIGLQLRFVIDELVESGENVGATVGVGVVVLFAVILVRVVYVYIVFTRTALEVKFRSKTLERSNRARLRQAWGRRERRRRNRRAPRDPIVLTWKERLLVAWTGMRGIVTLAAAAAIPATTALGERFPGRASIQFIAFVVAIGTLVIQGATLPLLSRSLKMDTADEEAEELEGVAAAERAAVGDTPFERRKALAKAVVEREIDDEHARIVIQRIDLQQAADEAAG
jgi:CPA1 family monovalent cation:H+ antiporter